MFIWIDNGKYITAIKTKFICVFVIWITRMIDGLSSYHCLLPLLLPLILKTIWMLKSENAYENTTFCGFSLIHLMIFWI